MRFNLPNTLTIVRLFAAPMVGFVFLLLPRPFSDWIALFLFVGASMTDYLDGLLARKWGQESRFGTMLPAGGRPAAGRAAWLNWCP